MKKGIKKKWLLLSVISLLLFMGLSVNVFAAENDKNVKITDFKFNSTNIIDSFQIKNRYPISFNFRLTNYDLSKYKDGEKIGDITFKRFQGSESLNCLPNTLLKYDKKNNRIICELILHYQYINSNFWGTYCPSYINIYTPSDPNGEQNVKFEFESAEIQNLFKFIISDDCKNDIHKKWWIGEEKPTVSTEGHDEYYRCKYCFKELTPKKILPKLKPYIKTNIKQITINPDQYNYFNFKFSIQNGDSFKTLKILNKDVHMVYTNKGRCIYAHKAPIKTQLILTTKYGATLKIPITVRSIKTTKITGVKSSLTLKVKKTATLKPVLTPKNSTEKVTYKSSNAKIATVTSAGKITAKKKGTAYIYVKSGKKTVKCKVVVK